MSIEIIKENFSVEETVGGGEVQNLFETEVYLNIPFEEIENIIWVQGDVRIQNTMIIKDKILVNGNINYNILSKDKEEELHTLETSKDFNEEIAIKGIKEDMQERVNGKIEYIEYEIEENKIIIKTLINLEGRVESLKNLEIIEKIENTQDLEVLEESLNYRQSYGSDKSIINIEEIFKIDENKPEIEKVLKFFVDAVELESTVVEDRIVLSGEAIATLICKGGEEIFTIKESIDFNHFLEIPGAIEGLKPEIGLNVEMAEYEVVKDEEDELRRIAVNIKIKADGRAYGEREKDLLIDAYSIKEELEIHKEEISLLETIDDIRYEENIDLEIPINAIDILDIRRENRIIEKTYENNKIIVEGTIDLSIYYIDRIEGEISSFKNETPYKIMIPYENCVENPILDIREKIGEIDFTIRKENIDINTNMFFEISLKKEKTIFAIKDIFTTGNLIDKRNKPSIIVYIVQRGDTLWDIAKRYNTTIEDILSSNGFPDEYKLQVLDKIIIEKKVNLNF